jgi:dephospho-CoA kinase
LVASVVLGILGGVGSGKSTVAAHLGELGAEVIDADRIAHETLEEDDVRAALRSWWGNDVFRADGSVDRPAVAARVFSDARERARLEALVLPRVRQRIEARVRAFRAQSSEQSSRGGRSSRPRLLVLDAPLLASSPLLADCDEIVFVEAREDQRRERTRLRGWGAEELAQREGAQAPLDEKRKLATRVVDNTAGLSYTRRQVEELYECLTGIQTQGKE